ncbi:MAG: hypothetical protein U5K27_02090 [Desulfotignum sp.]|nr:hypothetical protein [Desulfotignum sp.]
MPPAGPHQTLSWILTLAGLGVLLLLVSALALATGVRRYPCKRYSGHSPARTRPFCP